MFGRGLQKTCESGRSLAKRDLTLISTYLRVRNGLRQWGKWSIWWVPQLVRIAPCSQVISPSGSGLGPHEVRRTPPSGQP